MYFCVSEVCKFGILKIRATDELVRISVATLQLKELAYDYLLDKDAPYSEYVLLYTHIELL